MQSSLTMASRIIGRKDTVARNEAAVRRGGMGHILDEPPPFAVGAARGPSRYQNRYGKRYGVGQTDVVPPNGRNNGRNGYPSGCGVPHGRTAQECPVSPPRCDCHVIGANTLTTAGIAEAAFGTLTVDSGDACSFDPFYIAMFAIERVDNDEIVATGLVIPGLLVDSRSGQEPNLRRASQTDASFGIITLIYGDQKELECVDWNPFSSTGQQQLFLTFFNPNDGTTNGVHFFVTIWGTPYA